MFIDYLSLIIYSGKNSLEFGHFQFSKMDQYRIRQFVNKDFLSEICFSMVSVLKEVIFENWERLSCREFFLWKNEQWFIRIPSFLKICLEAIRKKVGAKLNIINKKIFLCFKFVSWKIIFCLLGGYKVNFIAPCGAKNLFFDVPVGKKSWATREKHSQNKLFFP